MVWWLACNIYTDKHIFSYLTFPKNSSHNNQEITLVTHSNIFPPFSSSPLKLPNFISTVVEFYIMTSCSSKSSDYMEMVMALITIYAISRIYGYCVFVLYPKNQGTSLKYTKYFLSRSSPNNPNVISFY